MSSWKPSAWLGGTVRMTSQMSPHVVFAKYGSPQTRRAAASPSPMTPWSDLPRARAHASPSKIVGAQGPPLRERRVAEPLPPEDEIVEGPGDPQEGREGPVAGLAARPDGCRATPGRLGRVRPHRRPLGRRVAPDVDPVGDLGACGEGALEGGRVELLGEPVDPSQPRARPARCVSLGTVASSTRAVPASRAAQGADLVDAHVVPVAVPSVGVVAEEQVGTLCAQDAPPAVQRPPRRGARQNRDTPGQVGLGLRAAPAVGVPDPLDAGDPQRDRRGPRLREPARPRAPSDRRSSAARPAPPSVARTSTTRWPAAARLAMVPAVSRASSSGCAWNATIVRVIEAHPVAWHALGP